MGAAFSTEKDSKLFPSFASKIQDLTGKTVLITGCTSGTGLVAAKLSAEKGAHVLMLNRPSERAKTAFETVQGCASSNAKVTSIDCDLSDFESVRKSVVEVKKAISKLDVLCNNAGVMAFPDQATKDGYDIQMQTNHLSHFLLTRELMPLLDAAAAGPSGEARIVNHSSLARGAVKEIGRKYLGKNGGNLDGDGHGAMMNGPRWIRYGQTKLANAVFTNALHTKLSAAGSKVKAVVAAPGASSTALMDNTATTGEIPVSMKMAVPLLSAFFIQSAEDGTLPLLTCMFDSSVQSGEFYEPVSAGGMYGLAGKKTLEPHCLSEENAKVLWEASCEAVGDFPIPTP